LHPVWTRFTESAYFSQPATGGAIRTRWPGARQHAGQ
jgi:hypothetical protein